MTRAGDRDHDWIMAETERIKALGETEPRLARDPVNQPMINNWLEAIGETDPRFTARRGAAGDGPGVDDARPRPGRAAPSDPLHGTMQCSTRPGFTSVLGTNCDQTYERYLRVGRAGRGHAPGSRTSSGRSRPASARATSSPPRTPGGSASEVVATMLFRVLKFKPGPRVPTVRRTRPVEDRPADAQPRHRLLLGGHGAGRAADPEVQRLRGAAAPARAGVPVVPRDGPRVRRRVAAAARSSRSSCTTRPQLPGKELPLTLALVELDEGVRMVGDVRGDPEDLAIGDPVEVGSTGSTTS